MSETPEQSSVPGDIGTEMDFEFQGNYGFIGILKMLNYHKLLYDDLFWNLLSQRLDCNIEVEAGDKRMQAIADIVNDCRDPLTGNLFYNMLCQGKRFIDNNPRLIVYTLIATNPGPIMHTGVEDRMGSRAALSNRENYWRELSIYDVPDIYIELVFHLESIKKVMRLLQEAKRLREMGSSDSSAYQQELTGLRRDGLSFEGYAIIGLSQCFDPYVLDLLILHARAELMQTRSE